MTIEIPKAVEACRALYGTIAKRSEAPTMAAFNAAVVSYFRDHDMLGPDGHETCAPSDLPARSWCEVALVVRFTCKRCAGTGAFITGSLNGQPTGPGGACFRCKGKGTQADADVRRNWARDRAAFNEAARAMLGNGGRESRECPDCGERCARKGGRNTCPDDQAAARFEEMAHGRD